MVTDNAIGIKTHITRVVVGLAVMIVLSLGFLAILGMLILKGTIPLQGANVAMLPIHLIASYIGCLIALSISKNSSLVAVICVIGASIFLHIALSILIFDKGLGGFIWVMLPETAGGFMALITKGKGANSRNKPKFRKSHL